MMRWTMKFGLAATLALGLASPGWAQVSEPMVAADADVEASLVPVVKVEIKHRGGVIKSGQERLSWDEAHAIRLSRGERIHDLTVQVARKDDKAKSMRVTLCYELDGELIVEDYSYNTRAKKREVLRVDGGIALAVTVTPKALERDTGPVGREDKLESGDADDPLGGL